MPQPLRGAVFFDRDGVLNLDSGFAHRPDQIAWTPGAAAAVARVNAAGLLALVVTNQSGVARGLYGEGDVRDLHAWMARELAQAGARIDAWRFCPHHPEISGPCACRKPLPGMLEQLIAEHGVDRARSFMVGDRDSDMAAAAAAGVRGALYAGGNLEALVAAEIARLPAPDARGRGPGGDPR